DPGSTGRHALYRVFQEALSNAARHGGAAKVAVRLDLREEAGVQRLWMSVRDNGSGFRVSEVALRRSGLAGMCARMRAAGGRLVVGSTPGRGSTVRAALAIPRDARVAGVGSARAAGARALAAGGTAARARAIRL